MDRPGRTRKTADSLTADGRTTRLTDAGENDRRNRESNRHVTVTNQKFTTRHSVAGASNFNYELDLWETSPKTDYTYSRSCSYLKQSSNENYIRPNMSRRSLRGGSSQFNESLSDSSGLIGTDLEEEEEEEWVRKTRASQSVTVGNHRNHVTKGQSAVVSSSRKFSRRFKSFLVTVIQTCVALIAYLPRKASGYFQTSSSAASDGQSCRSTKRQRGVVTTATGTSTTRAAEAAHSERQTVRDCLSSVGSFVFMTLIVGLASWAVYGFMTILKALWKPADGVWRRLENLLSSTVTRTSRVLDAAAVSRTSSLRGRYGCCCLFPLLFLLPLLVIGLFYFSSCPKEMVIINSVRDQFSAYFHFQSAASKEMENLIKIKEPSIMIPSKDYSEGSVESSNGNLLAIAMLEERMRSLFFDHKTAVHADQERALATFRSHLDHLVKLLIQHELQVQRNRWNVQINSIETTASDYRVHVLGEQHRQTTAIAAMRAMIDDLAKKSEALSDELMLLRKGWTENRYSASRPQLLSTDDQKTVKLQNHMKQLNEELIFLKTKYSALASKISKWPSDEQMTQLIRTRILDHFTQVMSGVDDLRGSIDGSGQPSADGKVPFGLWLTRQYASQDDLDHRLTALAASITKETNEMIRASKDDPGKLALAVAQIIAKSKAATKEKAFEHDSRGTDNVVVGTSDSTSVLSAPCALCDRMLTEADVLTFIRKELEIYDTDKTGKMDYALESAGGSVVRYSETYQLRPAQTSVFGIPLWYTYNSPRVVIQPGMQPGECWAFAGSQGYVVIQLSRKIFITEVSIEHIPKSLAPSGTTDSAPKECGIWGLENEMDMVGTFLGGFRYRSDGNPIQTYVLKPDPTTSSFKFVELRINSNHGNEQYTCLYRFRVNGYLDLGTL